MFNFIKFKKTSLNSIPKLGFTLSALVFIAASALFISQPVMAKMSLDTPPSERAQSYTYWKLASKCVKSHMRNTIKTTPGDNGATSPKQAAFGGHDGTDEGEWFANDTAFGYVYPDGKVTCAEVMSKGLPLWGWSTGKSFLEAMGYKFETSTARWISPDYDGEKRFGFFKDAILKKVGNIVDLTDEAAKHFLYLNAFSGSGSACKAQPRAIYNGEGSDATLREWADNNTTQGQLDNKVTYTALTLIVDGKPVKYIYTYSDSVVYGSTVSVNSGTLWQYRGDGSSSEGIEETIKCSELITNISSSAAKLEQWISIHKSEDGSVAPDSGSLTPPQADNPTTCVVDGIGWMVCPVLGAMGGLNDLMYGLIEGILVVDPLSMTQSNEAGVEKESPQYETWKNVRDLANVALVIGFIIIIFSQITGAGISNYGVKKMLPRLIIIAIAINISFFIMAMAIDLTNVIGASIHNLFSGIAVTADAESLNTGSVVASLLTGGLVTAAALAIAPVNLSALALMALPFIAVAALALIAAFATLFIRNALIIVLVVLSPLAIAAYLLPNTQDLFNKWRKLFVSMLILFPTAAVLFAGAKFVAHITLTTDVIIAPLIAIFIMAAPLGMLPFLIKSSNSLLANIGGKMMGMAQKARNPLQKSLDPHIDKQRAQYQAGKRNFLGMKQRPGKTNRAQRSFARKTALEKETTNMTAESMEQLRENAANPRTNKKGAPLKSDLRMQSALDGEQTLATRKAANDSTFKTRSDQRKATAGTADNTFNVRAEDNAIESASYADRMEADRSKRVLTNPQLASFDNASKEAKLSTARSEAEGQRRFDDRVANNTGLTDTLQATRRAQEASKVMGLEQDLRFEQDRGTNPNLRNLAQRQADAELKIDHAKSETSMTTKSSQASNIGLQDVKLATEANKRAGGLLDKEFEQVVAEASTSAGAANLVAQGYDAGTVDAVRTTATQTSVVSAAIDSAASVQRGEYAEELRANSSMQAAAAGIDPHGEPRVVAQAIESQRKAHDGNVAAYGVQIRENGTPSDTLLLNVEDTSLPVAAREAAGRALVDGGDIEKIKPYMDYLATALATAATPEDAEAVKYLQKAFAERINSSPGKPMGIGAGDIAAMTQGTYSTPSPVPSIGSMPMTKEASDLLLGTGGVAPSASLIQTYNTVVEKGVSPEGWATMDKNDITAITELIQAGAMPASRIDTMKESLRKSRKDDRINNRIKERERDLLNNLEKLL